MLINWKDVTTYSQRDTEKIPRTLELYLKELDYRVIITRHIHYENTWLLNCKAANIDQLDLKTDDMNEAKKKAFDIIEGYLNKLVERATR